MCIRYFGCIFRRNLEELARKNFLWQKKAVASEKLVLEKMEMQSLQLQVIFKPFTVFSSTL